MYSLSEFIFVNNMKQSSHFFFLKEEPIISTTLSYSIVSLIQCLSLQQNMFWTYYSRSQNIYILLTLFYSCRQCFSGTSKLHNQTVSGGVLSFSKRQRARKTGNSSALPPVAIISLSLFAQLHTVARVFSPCL